MTPEEIRNMPIGGLAIKLTPDLAMNAILREIAAQLAEANQHRRQRAEKKKHTPEAKGSGSSGVRRSSATKRFFVEHWMLEAEETMMPDFTPVAGSPHWMDLGVGQTTTGRLGTFDNAKITRRQ